VGLFDTDGIWYRPRSGSAARSRSFAAVCASGRHGRRGKASRRAHHAHRRAIGAVRAGHGV